MTDSNYKIEILKNVAEEMHQGINTVIEKIEYVDKGLSILQSKHITNGFLDFSDARLISETTYLKYKEKYQPKVNDVLVCNIGTIGSSLRVTKDEKFLIAWNLFLVKLKETKLDSQYFSFYLEYLKDRKYFDKFLTGGTVKFINKKTMGSIPIPLPPLSTQQQIAAILDKADALRKKDQQLLSQYDQLLQSIFYDMFGDPVKNEKGWEKTRLKNVCIQITDGTHFSPPSQTEGFPYITAKHVKLDGVDFYANPTFVSEKHHNEIYSRCSPKKGDVLYIKDGATTGIAAVNEYDFEFSMLSSLALLKPDPSRLNNYYLTYWLNNSLVKDMYIRTYMAGAAIKRFTLQKINSFDILIPPISLQNQFAEIAKNINHQKQQVKQQMVQSENLFQSLLQRAFKGELVV